jgi:S1-C subfamily serine protease
MSSDFWDSIILISSSDPSRSRDFGTGFVIHKEGQAVYLLTCAHVVRDVGGSEKVIAGGTPATVIASGEKQGFDLAVLRIEGLWDKPRLSLCASAEEEQPFIIAGFYQFDPKSPPALRKIRGKLGEQISLASSDGRERIYAWDLRIEGEYYLQPGYSGSPVVNQTNGCVLGVVTHQIGKGEKGLAISIEALRKIWYEMPSGLISKSPSPQASRHMTSSINVMSNSTVTNLAEHVNYNEASNSIRELTINFSGIETVPQTPSANTGQIERLQKRLEEALNLLDEYEQQELLTTDAKTRRNAQVEQERLREKIERYEQQIKHLEY